VTGLLNISSEDAEEYSQSLAQIGEGWWRQIAWAFRQGIPEALGMSRREWAVKYHGYFKLEIPERQEAVKELAAEGMSQPAIADTLGVSLGTVNSDIHAEDEPAFNSESRQSESADPPQVAHAEDEPAFNSESPDELPVESESGQGERPIPAEETVALIEPAEPGWHQLGDHLLYCGDSTDPAFIEACKGTFAFADPPYNAGKAEWDAGFVWDHDYLIDAADIVAVTPGIAALKGFHTITTMPYQWSIAAEITNGMTRGALGFGNWIYVALFSNGSLYRNAKDYLRVPAHTGDDKGGNHAARKPLRLLTELIGLFTSKGDTVIDPFLGSGTTLIAADRLERRCIGAEIDPMHCAEIIQRYHEARS
jgi:DNA modification methylase